MRIILILFLLTSCHSSKTEWEIKLVKNPALSFWQDGNFPCFKSKTNNEIKLTFSLLSKQKIPQNTYHYGMDVITLTSLCNYDALIIQPTDLIIDSKIIIEYLKTFPNIVATNLYIKFNMKSFEKYILKEFNSKKLVIYSIIADSNSPLKSFYIEDYRIENPAFEINRINSKIKPDNYTIILLTNEDISHKNKDYFNTLLQNLYPKPQLILAKTDKFFKIQDTLIYPLPKDDVNIKITKTLGFSKIRKEKINSEIDWHNLKELNLMIKKTNDEFEKKLCILTKPLTDINLTQIIAKGIANFLYSDIVIIPSDTSTYAVSQGEITHKDIYRILKNPEDKLVYIKVKGENISNIINNFSKQSQIYINSKNLVNEKPVFINSKIYRITTTLEFIKKNDELLNYIMEFSVLNIKIKQPVIWYFKNLKRI